jgi:Glyoxalase-like domain
MSWELDHVFFACVDADAAERELTAFGFTFTVRRIHAGQGTANACAVFENAFFELLHPRDVTELNSELVRPLGLAERLRWRETGACPFGLCFRPTGAATDPGTWPFDTWGYAPPYVPAGTSIPIVTPQHALSEPLIFISNRSGPSPSAPIAAGAPHGGAPQGLTSVRVYCPRADASSPSVQWFADHGFFFLEEGPELRLDLELNHGRAALKHSFRPRLPIDVSS